MSSQYVSEFTKVLYANYEAIFTDIEKQYPNFYQIEYLKQWEILEAATKVYQDELKSSQTPQISFQFPNATDNSGDGANGSQTSGNEATNQNQ